MPQVEPIEVPLALRVLDHQIQAPDGSPVANVDDIELELSGNNLTATALLCGPGALGERLPGRLGTWTLAIWRRITLDPYPRPLRVPLTEVQDITSAVILTPEAARTLQRRLGLETWLQQHLIDKIPGSGAEASSPPEARPRRAPDTERENGQTTTLRLSALLEFEAHHGDSLLGRVHEATALRTAPANPIVGAMRIVSCTIGPRATGSTLGYDHHCVQGPALLRAGILALHRHDLTASASDVTNIDVAHRHLTVDHAEPAHV